MGTWGRRDDPRGHTGPYPIASPLAFRLRTAAASLLRRPDGLLVTLVQLRADLHRLATSPTTTDQDALALLARHPFLAGSVLEAANAGVGESKAEVETIGDALSRVGLKKVRERAQELVLYGRAPRQADDQQLVAEIWARSVACAVAAREIAELRREPAGRAYVAGLLHDVGRIVLLVAKSELGAHFAASSDELASTVDDLHEEVGLLAAMRWQLSPTQAEAIRWHHHPERAQADTTLARIVRLGDLVAHAAGFGIEAVNLRQTPEGKMLGLESAAVEQLRRKLPGLVRRVLPKLA